MNSRSFRFGISALIQAVVGTIAMGLLLASCGGGGNSSGDVISTAPPAPPSPVSGPDSFLLYPNPQSAPAINTLTYAQAYYAAIDPNNVKDTLAKWKNANGFGSGTGSEVQAVFGDVRDLGYGRYVTGRMNTDGAIAILVDNYLVWTAAGYSYSNLNVEAAAARDQRWYIGTNAIEFSPGPNGGKPFAKYFTFDPSTGARLLAANLDGRGDKAMPGICIGCHGGRGDPLTPPNASGVQLFPVVGNPASAVRGDVRGKLHFFEPDTFGFSTLPGYTRAAQEAALKTLNKIVLCTYPLPLSASGVANTNPEDSCRMNNIASIDEWQGDAAPVLKDAYGGDGLPSATYSESSNVPASWASAGQSSLYLNVVKPTCRMCHILRGVGQQSDDDFTTFAVFQSWADRIKHHVIDSGNMPMVKVLYNRYWSTPSMYNELNAFLMNPTNGATATASSPAITYKVLDSSGNPLLPGRPIADAGPDRTIGTTTSTLSAAGSLYADTYTWSIVSNPGNAATLSSVTGLQTNFNASADGTYVVQLLASKGSVSSDPVNLSIVVNSLSWPGTISPLGASAPLPNPKPSAIRFSDIKKVLQQVSPSGSKTCISCHIPNAPGGFRPPIIYADIDRNGDGVVASSVGGTDDVWLYTEVLGRINFSDIEGSPLLRHPAGYHHAGGILFGFGDQANHLHADDPQLPPGDPRRSYYDMFLNWILNGAPY